MSSEVFPLLNAEDEGVVPTELESICVNCEEMGITRLLLTAIPHCKDVILMSFHCDHCGYHNNEIQSGSKVQEQGLRLILKIKTTRDMNRQVVKSEYASVCIPQLQFEIPHCSQAGEITTVEGILMRVADALNEGQSSRTEIDPETAKKISDFLEKLNSFRNLTTDFTLIVDDPSGNSFIENPIPTEPDAQLTVIHYHRSLEQDKLLALVADDAETQDDNCNIAGAEEVVSPLDSNEAISQEVLHFATPCPDCKANVETNMKFVNIPNFKEVVIMATNCTVCGHRSSEVKSGGSISDKGTKLTLLVTDPRDLCRDLLKSETCSISIPELEIEVGMGALSGRFTTVEGIIASIKEQLSSDSVFLLGDSAEQEKKVKMEQLLLQFDDLLQLKTPFHIVLDDPTGNSYVESLAAPDERLTVEQYTRSWEENENLGLNDMKVDGYDTANMESSATS